MFTKLKQYSPSAIMGFVLTLSALFIIALYLPSVIIALSGKNQLEVAKGQALPSDPIEVWWPQDETKLQGVQTFKALLRGENIDQYSMTWQLDNGAEVPMTVNNDNLPHEQASVDVSGWTWNGSGPYVISFRAKDGDSNVVASTSVEVYVASTTQQTLKKEQPDQTASLALTPLSTLFGSASPSSSSSPSITSQLPVQQAASSSITVWSPVDTTIVSGSQTLKATVPGAALSSYKLFWQVDSGSLNELSDSSTDFQHKEYVIDFSGWNWHGTGPYHITLIAKDNNNTVIANKTLTLLVAQNQAPQILQVSTLTPTTPRSVITSTMNPFKNQTLFVSTVSDAATQATAWQSTRPADAALLQKLASTPVASWFGNWDSSIYNDVKEYVSSAAAVNSVPVLVSYDIPQRDCGGYSAGGADSAESYEAWITQFASAIGNSKAAVILEPDSLAQSSCLSSTDLSRRYDLLDYAVTTLKAHANTAVYLDAGHSGWINADEMAAMLKQADINKADGFALDVSNFTSTTDNTSYGQQVSALLGGEHFVIDTSRNGAGGNGQWCNPSDQALGDSPSVSTGNPLIDAYLWIKTPGESDGTCNGGPSAGTWWPDYVLDLAKKAGW